MKKRKNSFRILLSVCKQRRRAWVGGQGARAPPSDGYSGNFRKLQNFISTAHVHDDIMGFKCIHSLENC